MTFTIRPDPYEPTMQNDGLVYEGFRFKAECYLAGKIYGSAFGVDVAFGDPMLGDPDVLKPYPTHRMRGQVGTKSSLKQKICHGLR